MIAVRWTPTALGDLKAISQRIEQERSLATANRVCRTIYDSIQMLRRHPNSVRPGREEGSRELVIRGAPYVVVYRLIKSEAVQLLNIWHGAQNR